MCFILTITTEILKVDDMFKTFWELEDHNIEQRVLSIDERTVVEYFSRTYCGDEQERLNNRK